MKTVHDLGIDCDVLDYVPDYFDKMYHVYPEGGSVPFRLKTHITRVLLSGMLKERSANFERFVSQHLKLSKKMYHAQEEFDLSAYDAIITGSDQVWHPRTARFDPVYFLSGAAFADKKKYSYAASFGIDQLPTELETEYQKRLSGYRMISVRESSGVPIVEALTGSSPVVSCDPTFLLSTGDWQSIAGSEPLVKGDYIFLYYVKMPEEIRSYAKQLSKRLNCRVVCCSCLFPKSNSLKYHYLSGKADREDGFETRNAISPDQYLNLILHSKYVLTSSFHATVFSILFHKQFLSQVVWEDGSINDRVQNLLSLTGLSGRTINHLDSLDEEIPWCEVDRSILEQRENGLSYLASVRDDMEKS